MKLITIILTFLFLTGCAFILHPPSKPAPINTKIISKLSEADTLILIHSMAMKCWSRPQAMNGDGRNVTKINNIISVNRYASDVGISPPFFKANVSGNTVSLTESIWGWAGLVGSHRPIYFNYSSDVSKWLKGSRECFIKEEPVF